MAVWHRRAGKDDVDLHWTATALMERVGTYWYLLPQANQARRAIWEAVNSHTGKRRIDEAFPKALRESTRENEMFIRFKNGSAWHVLGSDNYDSLVGAPPVGVVLSEWALADPQAWAYLRPILLENGGWALFNYTPRGRNHGATTYDMAKADPDWFAERLTVDDTGIFSPADLEREKREYIAENGPDIGAGLFEQEYYCSFQAAMLGAVYGREMTQAEKDKRFGKVPYDPQLPVHTAWDLGQRNATAIWFCQRSGLEWRLVDYLEGTGAGLDWYVKQIKEKPYSYGEALLPHDAEVTELGTGRTRVETLESLGLTGIRVVQNLSVEDGINAARTILPMCWFDEEKCKRGLEALRQYSFDWDDKRKAFSPRPRHDWASDASDAFRYLAVGTPVNAAMTRAGPKKLKLTNEAYA